MTFSKDVETRAKAKLNLSDWIRLETSIHRVVKEPETVSSIVLAEACLTPEEVV